MKPDRVVVDTSLALKWVVQEDDSDIANALLATWIAQGVIVLAPSLMAYEIANAVHQRVRRGDFTPDDAEQAFTQLYSTGINFRWARSASVAAALSARALEIARDYNLGVAYDTQFLALAEHEDCEYWTADRRFFETVRRDHPRVQWLGAYQPPQVQPAGPTPTP